jgi:hypothetical protein
MEINAEGKIRFAQAKFVKREFTKGRKAHNLFWLMSWN